MINVYAVNIYQKLNISRFNYLMKVYNEKVKKERNDAQDKLRDINELIAKYGFSEDGQKKLLELLDRK